MNPRFSPNLRQLRAFLAVYRLRKLSAAAEQLFVTQSTISVLLRQMEEGLGVVLFDRTTRSLQPTAAAEAAIGVIERILRDVDSLGNDLNDLTQLQRGRISLAITPNLGQLLLPPALTNFREQYPQVQIQVDDCAPDQFLTRIVAEHVEFGIGTPERSGGEVDLSTLMRDHLAVVCHQDHPLAALRQVRWRDLAGHDIIAGRQGYGVRQLVDQTAAKAGINLRVAHEVSFQTTGVWLARSRLGAAIMPSAYATNPTPDNLVVKPLTAPRIGRDLFVVTKRGRSLSPACAAFIATLRALSQTRAGKAQPRPETWRTPPA